LISGMIDTFCLPHSSNAATSDVPEKRTGIGAGEKRE
jgi:hypothetical protein